MHLQIVIRTACRTAALLGNSLILAVVSQREVPVAVQDPAPEDQLVQVARAEAQAAQVVVQVAMAGQEEATEARVEMAAEAVEVAADLNIS